jgi:DsbC/DsbD-like thiol-disulfide interchange protein
MVICGLALFARTAHAQTPPELPAKVELIAEGESVPLRHPLQLWAGLLFNLDPGWHIYWKNPGDSGEPPKIQWTLPDGFHEGPIRWPTPKRLGHGSVVDYGYEGQVLLIATIEGPVRSDGMKLREIPLTADVRYVVCREICIPAKAHLTLTVPASTNTSTEGKEWAELLRTARAQLPKPVSPVAHLSVEASEDHFILSAERLGAVRSATFFPDDPNVVENAAPQEFVAVPDGFQLTLKKSELLTRRPERLWGLLVLDGGNAYQIGPLINWR